MRTAGGRPRSRSERAGRGAVRRSRAWASEHVTAQLSGRSCILMSRQAEPAPSSRVRAGGPNSDRRWSQGRIAVGGRRSAISQREPVSSPRRQGERRKGVPSVDVRPSELDPYPRAERDLGSAVLWQRSLHRSKRRRIRQRDARRNAPRQKGATLAAGAAILASPVLSPLTGAAGAASSRPGVTKAEVAQKAAVSGGKTWLLSYGDTGEAVAAVQTQLQIPSDGIFGPQTEGAVKTFQLNNGLAGTGIVDARTWAEIFGSKVLFYGDSDASASSTGAGAGEKVNVVYGSDVPDESTGGPDIEDRGEVRDEIEEAESDPAPTTAPESAPAPVS